MPIFQRNKNIYSHFHTDGYKYLFNKQYIHRTFTMHIQTIQENCMFVHYIKIMKQVKITAVRIVNHSDLMELYENPIEHTCDVCKGQSWISRNGQKPEGFCSEAWKTMKEFVEALANGQGNFYDGWMKNPNSAMISCNDGFRPVSFYIETIE